MVRCGEGGSCCVLVAGRGGGSILRGDEALTVVLEALALTLSLETVRAILPVVPRFACSIIPCTLAEIAEVAAVAADLKGEAGLSGEMGRAMKLLVGDAGAMMVLNSLMGERGSVRELWDRGERTDAVLVEREVGRVVPLVVLAGAAFPRLVFLLTGKVSCSTWFSLSDAIWISELIRFRPLGGAGCGAGRVGDGIFCCSSGSAGRGRSLDACVMLLLCSLAGDAASLEA